MLTDDGLIKVLDFGLAKLTGQGVSDEFDDARTMCKNAAQTRLLYGLSGLPQVQT